MFDQESYEVEVEEEADCIDLLERRLRDPLGPRTVYVECPVPELTRRLAILLPHRLSKQRPHNGARKGCEVRSLWVDQHRFAGHAVVFGRNLVFLAAMLRSAYRFDNVTDWVLYHPRFWKSEQEKHQ